MYLLMPTGTEVRPDDPWLFCISCPVPDEKDSGKACEGNICQSARLLARFQALLRDSKNSSISPWKKWLPALKSL